LTSLGNRADAGEGRGDDPRTFRRRLLLIALAGLLARLLFLALESGVELMGDEPSWVALAERLARGRHSFSPGNRALVFYPPLYPYFIALCQVLFGTLTAVKWLQAVLGSLLVVGVGRLGRHLTSPRAALLAAGLTAFLPELVWYAAHFWSETLFLVLLWWSLERLLASEASGRLGAAALAGVLWGLATLTRETLLYFIPLVAVWLLPGTHRPRRVRAAGRAAAFAVAALLTIAPWTYRNWRVFHAFVPVSTFGAHSLWQGNTPLPREEVYRLSDAAEGPIAQYRLAWRMGWDAVRERQPRWILEKLRSEMPAFWGLESHALVHLEQGAYGVVSPRVTVAARCVLLLPYALVLGFFVVGLAATPLDRPRLLLLLFLAYYNALHVVTFAADRFRLPVLPVLFVLAAEAWVRWRQGRLRLTRRRRLLALILGLVALLVLLPSLLVLLGLHR
jgi:4-amino-4-deoxy-L-arabinose transferase-like glycosyltransferase